MYVNLNHYIISGISIIINSFIFVSDASIKLKKKNQNSFRAQNIVIFQITKRRYTRQRLYQLKQPRPDSCTLSSAPPCPSLPLQFRGNVSQGQKIPPLPVVLPTSS